VLDIIVIGGGPIGSQVAYRLAAVGRSVAVVEKREGIGQKPCCTGIISQECVSAFGIPPRVILKQTYCANLFSPAGETIKINRPETRVCVVDRPEFDRVLAERAQNAGTIYHLSSLAEHITVYQDRVIVDMENCGRRRHLEAQCAVLATGFNANLVKELGFGRVSYFAAGAQTEVELDGVEEIEVYLSQFLSPGFFSWLVPTSNGKGMVGLLTHLRPGLRLQEVLARLETQGKIKQGNHQIKYGGIPLKPLIRTRGDRLLVVGDAAGQVKPTTGGGLYFGLLCADIAADTLHQALTTGNLSARSLLPYEKGWRKKLGCELRVEYFVRRCYEHLSDRQINRIFGRINSAGIASSLLQNKQIAFDWHGRLLLTALRQGVWSEIKRVLHLP
jgi:digeranylgeranylglycerophospholipid reductase